MAKKDENLKRLKELSELLGREPDMSGSAADIAQRVAELEEELGDVDGTDSQASALTGQENNEVSAQPDTVTDTADLVTV
ncbi:TPA: DNA-packaging protein FI, partial [Escherichia coli]|nr:DNA-packaging protein FI [Escherichia coli]